MAGRYRFSVPERRGRTDPWFRVGSVDVTTSVLVAALCVLSFFVYAMSPAAVAALAQFPDRVRSGQVWRVFTWPFANEPSLSAAIGVAIFWYLGSQIENILGRTKFVWLLVLTTVAPGLLGVALNIPQAGIRSVELAIFVVFICEYPRTPFFFGVPAWVIGLVLVGIDILQLIGDRQTDRLVLYLVGIATAVWAARSFGMLTSLQWLPPIKLPGRGRATKGPRRLKSARGTQRSSSVVVDGPWAANAAGATGGYSSTADQIEVDTILDKISMVGMDGLTADEKRRLNEASRRLRSNGK